MLVEAFFILQLLVRSYPIVTADVSNITRLSSHWVESLGWLSDLLYISVVTLSCALIIIRKQVMKIDKLSKTDSLSECLNRHALKQLVPLSLQDAVSSNKHFALIMFDIDHFKNINDSYGHAIGDEAIKSVVASAKSCIRKSDHIFRLGGEEFLVVTLSDSLEASSQLAERIREKVEGALLQVENKTIRFTISLGVAEALSDEENWEQIMNRADEALYSAKQSGRNKVAVATSV
jgi:diguanylate cyclase (GGDEF)-like protein